MAITEPTIRQRKAAIALSVEKGSKYKALRAVGYSHAAAMRPTEKVTSTKGYLIALKEIEPMLREKRNMVLNAISKEKIDNASLKDTAIAFDILNKHHGVLDGSRQGLGNVTELRTMIVQQLNVFRGDAIDVESKDVDIK